ncbi:hypothetical protein SAMN05660197_1239 [Nitratiruptor tergarcus DSM 16512]|uniref:Replication restart DNA helicase PriA n=1 Tax=Nitratiruptor tergarcus DSM 16512 TaxID=1069081 RepID=A0A1W1WT01_9BACT|nr:hypothetical protein SAMN05660197_1239 [Nitratiruptor tergarcus DSM 16512]
MKIKVKKLVCPSCGADLRCECEKLSCAYCGYEEQVSLQPAMPRYVPVYQVEPKSEAKEYHCISCGASFSTDSVATLCPYCETALIGEFINALQPYSLIPFTMCAKEAKRRIKKHIRSLWFAPDDFIKDYRKHKEIQPYYYPLWLFNMDVSTEYKGRRGEYYYITKTRYINGKPAQVQERRTRWYPASGIVNQQFYNISVGGYKFASSMLRELQFDLTSCSSVDKKCLSGIETKEFDIGSKEATILAHTSLHSAIRRAIKQDIGGDTQQIISYTPHFYNEEMSYILVPIYHFSVKFKGKEYNYFVNGQSGDVVGERSYSWIKIFFFVLFVLSLMGGVLYILERLGYFS